ncbi:hypothetical protein RhiirA4_203465 [Rhizophagus irregularis]|uniref:Thiol-disulfide oxidoreductase n=1 Tax=Rhizophagus irregularis TaxID=588596 RepID=A0A2I1FXM2_9GLOM|nr:hypothetical protein RhiirA4_203465 [Rhizophagus irregularis]
MRIVSALKLKPGLNIIVLYDGVCNICNSSVQFSMKRNNKPPIIHYASLQSKLGSYLTNYYKLPNDLSTSVLLRYHISDDFLKFNDINLSPVLDKNKDYSTDEIINTELSLLPQPELLMKSDASLELVRYLDYPWPITYILKIFPKTFRDGVYDWWARNRYQNFGKTDSCQAPIPEWKERILDWKEFQSSE